MTAQRHLLKVIFAQALETLWAHRFRSFLTLLGVMIGTASVIAVGSLVSGLQRHRLRRFCGGGIDFRNLSGGEGGAAQSD